MGTPLTTSLCRINMPNIKTKINNYLLIFHVFMNYERWPSFHGFALQYSYISITLYKTRILPMYDIFTNAFPKFMCRWCELQINFGLLDSVYLCGFYSKFSYIRPAEYHVWSFNVNVVILLFSFCNYPLRKPLKVTLIMNLPVLKKRI